MSFVQSSSYLAVTGVPYPYCFYLVLICTAKNVKGKLYEYVPTCLLYICNRCMLKSHDQVQM